jgi:hypothetical protein
VQFDAKKDEAKQALEKKQKTVIERGRGRACWVISAASAMMPPYF